MNSILPRLQDIFHQAFGVDPQSVTMDTTVNDIPAWDSIGHLQLVDRLEKVFSLKFEAEELMEMSNVGSIVGVVESRLSRQQ